MANKETTKYYLELGESVGNKGLRKTLEKIELVSFVVSSRKQIGVGSRVWKKRAYSGDFLIAVPENQPFMALLEYVLNGVVIPNGVLKSVVGKKNMLTATMTNIMLTSGWILPSADWAFGLNFATVSYLYDPGTAPTIAPYKKA